MLAERARELGFFRDESLRPKSSPTSSDWYDGDYFDLFGKKGAYGSRLSWASHRAHYIKLANIILTGFPFSSSFLNVGCGRGLLERAMFELTTLNNLGFDVEGFDHSAYAISTGDFVAKPFIRLGSVDDFELVREYDVMIMINVLDHLTDDQVRRWLKRSMSSITTAVFAITARRSENMVEDFGEINIKDADGWNRLFEDCGWYQDEEAANMHRLANKIKHVKMCRNNAFYFKPRRSDVVI